MKAKFETLTVFKQFKGLVGLRLNKKIEASQSDWGGEFQPFKQYLFELGIIHRVICPHTYHENGVVERKHMHIVDQMGSLLTLSVFFTLSLLGSCFLNCCVFDK